MQVLSGRKRSEINKMLDPDDVKAIRRTSLRQWNVRRGVWLCTSVDTTRFM